MLVYNTEWGFLEFKEEELEEFFNKFSYNSLEFFDSILHFSGISGDNQEFVTEIKPIKERAQENKKKVNSKSTIAQEIRLLNEKELTLTTGLLNEATFCAQCDERYSNTALCLDYLTTRCEMELEKVAHGKHKVL